MKISPEIEKYRVQSGPYNSPTGNQGHGAFLDVPYKSGKLTIMAYNGYHDGWEHVSVSMKNRCPNWEEMNWIKSLFWDEEDCVIQFHPPKSKHVNNHPYCLHMWRCTNKAFPMPDMITVGIK
jgi:hypothetical protein